jgi:hypothetical protein
MYKRYRHRTQMHHQMHSRVINGRDLANSERTIEGEGLFLVAIALASSEKVSYLGGEEGPHGRRKLVS